MKNYTADITVALLGNVSAGKTTLLNALLKYKYGEVSMKRTTTAANYFRIHVKGTDDAEGHVPRLPDTILDEIIKFNQVKINKNDKVQEKYFNVDVDEPLVDCRSNTYLVILDIPGINEAHADQEYKNYVSSKWTSFDCIVLIMDGKYGVNTQDQVFLFDFVKENLQKKEVPVIVLCNKIDNPNDFEQAELVLEVKKEADKIFQPILDETKYAFIPFSSLNAYIHQCASTMTIEQFQHFDTELIDRLGTDQLGRKKWNKLSSEQKIEEAYKLVSDQSNVEEALRDSNFGTFISKLKDFVGGESTQLKLIEKQLDVARNVISTEPYEKRKTLDNLRICYERTIHLVPADRLECQLKDLRAAYWSAYESFQEHCLTEFESNFLNVQVLATPMAELFNYFLFLVENDVVDELERVTKQAELLVKRTIYGLISKRNEANMWEFWYGLKDRTIPDDSDAIAVKLPISPIDWSTIWNSMLFLSYHKHFCVTLGKEKLLLEEMLFEENKLDLSTCPKCKRLTINGTGGFYCVECKLCFTTRNETAFCVKCAHVVHNTEITRYCPGIGNSSCGYTCYAWPDLRKHAAVTYAHDGTFTPIYPEMYQKIVQIHIPDLIDDQKHFGHLLHRFCCLMDLYDHHQTTTK